MNGTTKFHKANGPAFQVGEVWVGNMGKHEVEIANVRKFGPEKLDYEVTYIDENLNQWKKDAWNFQVRYTHLADLCIKA